MSETAIGFKSFMGETISLKRWKLYSVRFGFLAFGYIALISVLDLPSTHAMATILVQGSLWALVMSLMFGWMERTSKFSRAVVFCTVGLISVLLVFLAWRGARIH